jgi:hypothetical protein
MHAFDPQALANIRTVARLLAGAGRLAVVAMPIYHVERAEEAEREERPQRVGRRDRRVKRERRIDGWLVRMAEGGSLAFPDAPLVDGKPPEVHPDAGAMATAINAVIVPLIQAKWATSVAGWKLVGQWPTAEVCTMLDGQVGELEEANELGVAARGAMVVPRAGTIRFATRDAAEDFCKAVNAQLAPLVSPIVAALTAHLIEATGQL